MEPRQIIEFMGFAEGLKNVLRHSYTTAGRRESVAEHAWMLCLFAMVVFDEVQMDVDRLKVLKMLIIHDLPEVITDDIPVFEKAQLTADELPDEEAAMRDLIAPLAPQLQEHIMSLFHEYELRESNEARLAYAIDKAEAMIQHNLADISTWDANDYRYQTDIANPRHQHIESLNPFFAALKAAIDADTIEKISKAGQAHRIDPQMIQRYGLPE